METITYRVHFKQGNDMSSISCLKNYFGCCSSIGKVVVFFSSCFSYFLFAFALLQFEYDMTRYAFGLLAGFCVLFCFVFIFRGVL